MDDWDDINSGFTITGASWPTVSSPFTIEDAGNHWEYNQGNRIANAGDVNFENDFTGGPITEHHRPDQFWWTEPYDPPWIPDPWYELLGFTPGKLYVTGRGYNYWGDNTATNYNSFIEKDTDTWVAIRTNSTHVGAKEGSSQLLGAGYNRYGQLGLGHVTTPVRTWTEMTGIQNLPVKDFSVSVYNVVVIDSIGYLHTAGYNETGQCGLDDEDVPYADRHPKTTFQQEKNSWIWKKAITGSAGLNTVALLSGGELRFTGKLFNATFGKSADDYYEYTKEIASEPLWGLLTIWQDFFWNGRTCFALRAGYTGASWYASGLNTTGQMGVGDNSNHSGWVSLVVPAGVLFTKISTGNAQTGDGPHSVALGDNGGAYVTGGNHYGQLAQGDNVDRNTWTQVGSRIDWVDAQATPSGIMLLSEDGEIWVAGRGTFTGGGGGNWLSSSTSNVLVREDTNTNGFVSLGAGRSSQATFALK